MIKKIIFVFLLCYLTVSCGKKGDPEYIDPDKKAILQNIIVKII